MSTTVATIDVGGTGANTAAQARINLGISEGASIPSLNIIAASAVTTISGQHYVLTNVAQTTVTLAASPSAGDVVYISAKNNLANNLIVPNGRNFESNSSNVIIDLPPYSLQLRYINSTLGWILI